MIPTTLRKSASEARVQPPWRETPFPQSRIPASIDNSIKLVVCTRVQQGGLDSDEGGGVGTCRQTRRQTRDFARAPPVLRTLEKLPSPSPLLACPDKSSSCSPHRGFYLRPSRSGGTRSRQRSNSALVLHISSVSTSSF
jgi:hypothetical protein